MIPNQFEYSAPATLDEAIKLLVTHQDEAKVLSGGQSLVSMLKLRLASPGHLVDLNKIKGLSYIRKESDGKIAIGAMTTYAEVKDSKLLQDECPLLPQAAGVVGDVQVRNRGTIGGSVAHADPAGDVPTAVLALGAEIKAVGPRGERWMKAEEFFQGMYATQLEPDEILTEIRVPTLKDCKSAYMKFARRPSDFAIVGVAAVIKVAKDKTCQDIALAFTGITDKPFRASSIEAKLKGTKLDPAFIATLAPLVTEGLYVNANMHGSAEYRTQLAGVYLSRVIQAAS